MDRVFESGASASPPSAPASPSSGYPTAGSPVGGIPATRPGPWWYHMITEELRAVIAAAGVLPDHTDLNQLLVALRSAGVFQTAPQFDNTTKPSTSEFVQRALGNLRTLASVNVSTTMTAEHMGGLYAFYGGTPGQTITLPNATAWPSGVSVWFVNQGSVSVTVAGGGADISANNSGSGQSLASTLLVAPGDSIMFSYNGASQWNAWGYTSAKQFPSSIGASGYQKLPSGLIVQWGTWMTAATSGNPVSVNFNIAFPVAALAMVPVMSYTSATLSSAWYDSLTRFGFQGRGSVVSNLCSYIAVGY